MFAVTKYEITWYFDIFSQVSWLCIFHSCWMVCDLEMAGSKEALQRPLSPWRPCSSSRAPQRYLLSTQSFELGAGDSLSLSAPIGRDFLVYCPVPGWRGGLGLLQIIIDYPPAKWLHRGRKHFDDCGPNSCMDFMLDAVILRSALPPTPPWPRAGLSLHWEARGMPKG